MGNSNDIQNGAAGLAALGICESLLLALSDLKVIGEKDIRDILEDVAASHRSADASPHDAVLDRDVIAIIDRLIAGR